MKRDEVIERVAKAIWNYAAPTAWEKLPERHRDEFRGQADAALNEMARCVVEATGGQPAPAGPANLVPSWETPLGIPTF